MLDQKTERSVNCEFLKRLVVDVELQRKFFYPSAGSVHPRSTVVFEVTHGCVEMGGGGVITLKSVKILN